MFTKKIFKLNVKINIKHKYGDERDEEKMHI